jgi:hypothetical protein
VPKIDETSFYGAFTTMPGARKASTIENLGEALNDYKGLRPAGMARFDNESVEQMLLYSVREYLTAFKNHVVLNLVKPIEKAFMRLFRALKKKFTAKNRYNFGATSGGRMAREVGPGAEDAMWADVTEVPDAATRAALRAYVDRNLDKYANLPLDAAGPYQTYVVEKRWWAYLRWLHVLHIIKHEKATLAELHDIEFKQARMFSILPLCSYDPGHDRRHQGAARPFGARRQAHGVAQAGQAALLNGK